MAEENLQLLRSYKNVGKHEYFRGKFVFSLSYCRPAVCIQSRLLNYLCMNINIANTQSYTSVSKKVVQQNRMRQCQKVLWVMGVHGH